MSCFSDLSLISSTECSWEFEDHFSEQELKALYKKLGLNGKASYQVKMEIGIWEEIKYLYKDKGNRRAAASIMKQHDLGSFDTAAPGYYFDEEGKMWEIPMARGARTMRDYMVRMPEDGATHILVYWDREEENRHVWQFKPVRS